MISKKLHSFFPDSLGFHLFTSIFAMNYAQKHELRLRLEAGESNGDGEKKMRQEDDFLSDELLIF